ncbi:MAG: four helix bundle protein [Candidatus Peribacteraceae bacterium]|jgi:four helix bundle protein
MKSFTELNAWKAGMDLVEEIYRLTAKFPKEEQFGLSSQIKRACASIVANTAEGFGRFSYADKAYKYVIARGECAEVAAFLLIAIRVKFLTSDQAQHALELTDTVGKLLSGLVESTRKRNPKSQVL